MTETSPKLIDKLQKSISVVHNPFMGWAILLISLIVTFFAYWFSSEQLKVRTEDQFTFRVDDTMHSLYERMTMYEQVLYGASGLFTASRSVTRAEWRTYVESLNLSQRLPGIQGLGYTTIVIDKERHIEEIQAEGFPNYKISPEHERDEYTAIVYLEPFDWRNQRAFGYDMWSNELRQAAMARARDTGEIATSAKITLVQETGENLQYGFLTYMPIYKDFSLPETLEERREKIVGWVYAAFRAGDLMNGILGSTASDISFEIYDGKEVNADALLFDSNDQPSWLSDEGDQPLSIAQSLVFQGHQWTVLFSASKSLHSSIGGVDEPKYILMAGILVDILLFYVLLSLHFINKHFRRSAKQLEKDFKLNQKTLKVQTNKVEAAQKESEAFFELAPEAFLIVSKAGIVVKANQRAHEVFGYEGGGLHELYLESLVPEQNRKDHSKFRFEYFSDPSSRMMSMNKNFRALKKSGDTFPASINLEPIEFRGDIHVVAVVHDVSQQRLLEQTMADARERAESASRSKSDFVANMSHEIRTPLNAVLGAAQLLSKTQPDQSQLKFINMIRSSGEALLGVVNDILDFSKIEAGRMELSAVPFDLSEVLSRVGLMMSINSGEKDLELVIHVGLDVQCAMVGDPLRLQQVLVNLASNAIKFTDSGRVVLSVEALDMDEGLQKLKFSLTDTGIGISLNQQENLFSAFKQADESITRRYGGTGLGLAISNQIVEMMGAQIKVVSKPQEGATFSFAIGLPIDEAYTPKSEILANTSMKVLMIDDSAESCIAVKDILSAQGFSLWAYYSWGEAKDALAGKPIIKEFDFVLLDWQLSSGDSAPTKAEHILAQLRKLGLKSDCASILLNSNNQCASLLAAGALKKFDAGLTKPILGVSLLSCLDDALVKSSGKTLLPAQNESNGQSGQLKGVRVLLVEDNIFNQTIAQGLLEDMGVGTLVASNGAEAIEMYEDSGHAPFDLILMDVQMPVMDGLSATKHLRSQLGCTLPIIAMTAGVLQSEYDKYLSNGMDDLVPKPIDENELFMAIKKALNLNAAPESGDKSVKDVTKPPIHQPSVFNSHRLELLSKGKSNRVKRIIDSIESLTLNGEQSLMSGWQAVELDTRDQAHILFHGLKGQVTNYGGEVFGVSLQSLEQALHENNTIQDLKPLFDVVIEDFGSYIRLANTWAEEQKQLFGGRF